MDKPDLILEAAAKRFALFGFRRTVLDDIARDAGIAKGSIYLHVTGKDDLFRQTVLREQRLITEAAREAASAGQEHPREALEAIVRRLLRWLDERLLGRLMTGDPEMGLGPELGQMPDDSCKEQHALYDVIGGCIKAGIARGLFRPDLVVEVPVTILISILHIHLHNRRQKFIELDDEVYIREMLRTIFEGIQICERGFHEEK